MEHSPGWCGGRRDARWGQKTYGSGGGGGGEAGWGVPGFEGLGVAGMKRSLVLSNWTGGERSSSGASAA